MARQLVAETLLADGRTLAIMIADVSDAPAMCDVIVDAFSHRPPVEPAPAALGETPAHVAADLARGFGVLALVDGEPAGVVLVGIDGQTADVHRVSVRPGFQRMGIASVMVGAVGDLLAARPIDEARLVARTEFPRLIAWWRRHGFTECGREGPNVHMRRPVAVRVPVPTADDMRALGAGLGRLMRPGDVVIASGELGAGKTVLAQGIGEGLGVAGPVVSPTFVLSRVYPSTSGGPAFVHVDAYRLSTVAELEDIDIETGLDDRVTYIEWGAGLAEGLADERLDVGIRRSVEVSDETRWVFLAPVGARWEAERRGLAALAHDPVGVTA